MLSKQFVNNENLQLTFIDKMQSKISIKKDVEEYNNAY